MNFRGLTTSMVALAALAACGGPVSLRGLTEPALVETYERAPPGSDPNSCWGKDVTPAVIETVTERIELQPAQVLADGTVLSEPVYKLETKQAIVKERRELWFQTPCDDQLTPDFIASLQRALKARGLYYGPPTSQLDARTRNAVRRFQASQGLDSSILSLSAARQLGLVAVDPTQ